MDYQQNIVIQPNNIHILPSIQNKTSNSNTNNNNGVSLMPFIFYTV